MIDDPRQFAPDWVADWNRHDIEAILRHFHEDVVFASPIARAVIPESAGIVRGKAALRDYWRRALAKVPDLHFTLIDVYVGVGAIVIHHRDQRGGEANEVLTFEGTQVRQGLGTRPQV
ncbi:YybH family protein [Sphingomonas profundi]|uniref:YybH family protein n=1 Tax=Alterirhizorhabdus profundi TaxID=2681549 RepID=UPI0012E8E983|nr:nuclear transport factor 2 family protein [Sphingomonas profundi]